MSDIIFHLTQAGSVVAWNASHTGLALNLTHIQMGSGNRVPDGTETALIKAEQFVPIAAGAAVSPSQIRLSAIFRGMQQYYVAEIALWMGEPGTPGAVLVFYWSQAQGMLAAKYPNVDFIFSHDLKLTNALPDNTLTIQADPDQSVLLALMAAHEAHTNPHPVYQRQLDDLRQRVTALEEKIKALEEKINTTTTNIAPSQPTPVTPLPAVIERGATYQISFAATDPDGDAVTFSLSNLIGCTASQASGITTAAGVSVTINPQADTVSFNVVAIDTKGATSTPVTITRAGNAIITLNSPPATPTITSDLPATITRSSSYTVKFAATDPDGDAVTFSLSNLIGCTASQASGITTATGVAITINPQADTLSFNVAAVDSKGATSTPVTINRAGNAIVNPTGSTGWLTAGQHVLDVPDWADTATFTGTGGASGTMTCTNDPYGQPYTFISAELLAQAKPLGWQADTGTSVWDVPYIDAYPNHRLGVIEYNGGKPPAGCYRIYSSTSDYRYFTLVNAATSAGESTIVSGAVTASFAGSAAGYTNSPDQTTQIKTLPLDTNRTITVYIPAGGTFKADWS